LLAFVVLLVGASIAYASHGGPDPALTLDQPQAASGEDVTFDIKNTEAYSTYTLMVENDVVARGSDPAGNGVHDKFTMPDYGSTEKTVTVQVQVEMPSQPGTVFTGQQTMQYVLFPTAPTGPSPATQPDPVPLAATPASQAPPVPAATTTTTPSSSASPSNNTTRTQHHSKHTTKNTEHKSNPTGGSGTSTPKSNSNTTTAPANNFSSGGTDPIAGINANTSVPTTSKTAQKPSGPVGTAGALPPTAPPPSGGAPPSGSSPLTTPITGSATVTSGGGGAPAALIVALALLALAAIAVGASRLRYVDWQRFAFAGAHDPDELRIGALSRAARSGAEAQEAIAVRKASRRAG
jgi:hypothetical protein